MNAVKQRDKEKSKVEAIKEFVEHNETLKQLVEKYVFMEALLCNVVR